MENDAQDPLTVLCHTWNLHRRIAKMCRNLPLRSIYLTMLDFLEDAVEGAEFKDFDASGHIAVHRELVNGIAEGPGERNQSFHNVRRLGFSPRYERPNWVWRPGR